MNKQHILIKTNDLDIRGELLLIDSIWAFSSDDAEFLSAFPAGTAYSFSHVAAGNAQQKLHDAIGEQVETF